MTIPPTCCHRAAAAVRELLMAPAASSATAVAVSGPACSSIPRCNRSTPVDPCSTKCKYRALAQQSNGWERRFLPLHLNKLKDGDYHENYSMAIRARKVCVHARWNFLPYHNLLQGGRGHTHTRARTLASVEVNTGCLSEALPGSSVGLQCCGAMRRWGRAAARGPLPPAPPPPSPPAQVQEACQRVIDAEHRGLPMGDAQALALVAAGRSVQGGGCGAGALVGGCSGGAVWGRARRGAGGDAGDRVRCTRSGAVAA
jgi:hypothetical protein